MSELQKVFEDLDFLINETNPVGVNAFTEASLGHALAYGLGAATGGVIGFFGGLPAFGVGAVGGTVIGAVGGAATGVAIYGAGVETAQKVGAYLGLADLQGEFQYGGRFNRVNRHVYFGAADFKKRILSEGFNEAFELPFMKLWIIGAKNYLNDLYDEKFEHNELFLPDVLLASIATVKNVIEGPRNVRSNYLPAALVTRYMEDKASLDNKSTKALMEAVQTTIKDGKFARVFGVSYRVQHMLEKGFNISYAGGMVSNKIREQIINLKDIQINVNAADGKVNLFKTFEKGAEGKVKIFLEEQRAKQYGYEDQKGVNKAALGDNAEEVINDLNADNVFFPSAVFGKETEKNAPEYNEDALKLLKNFDELSKDQDITTYNFQYYKTLAGTEDEPFFPALGSTRGNVLGITSTAATVSPFLATIIAADFAWNILWNAFNEEVPMTEVLRRSMEARYLEFVFKIFEDLDVDGEVDEKTYEDHMRSVFEEENFIRSIYSFIAVDKEIARRLDLLKRLEELLDDRDAKEPLTADELKKLETAGAKAFIETDVEDVKTDLTEEQIEDRQKFYKQCALLMNMSTLSPKLDQKIIARQKSPAFDGPSKHQPYGGRFYMATSNNKEALITNLVSSKDSSYMFEIPPHVMTQLRPKFRMYKVANDQDGKLIETEFIFPTHTDLSRKKNFKPNQGTGVESKVPDFLSSEFDKGDGCGLKSFSIDFKGTTPAVAKNDIKGSMNLYFQSFADFTRKRISNNGEEYRFVDLIIQPPPDNPVAAGIRSLRQYEPSFYRIRVEMGYNIPEEGEIEGISSDDFARLKNAIETMNQSYFLCMVDHNFNIKNDGTVDMNFTYYAYLETALRSIKFDALTTPELAKKRIENANKLLDTATSEKCTQAELRELSIALAGEEIEIQRDSLNSILRRLYLRNKVFNLEIVNENREFFLRRGFFKECNFINGANVATNADDPNQGDLSIVLQKGFLSEDPTEDFVRDANDTNVQFFFFGDLLHTVLDSLYNPDTKKIAVGLENTKIVLGSFDFDPYQKKNTNTAKSFNIANIPISVDFFSEWFRDNVLNQRSTRKTYPILDFIRSLSNYLVSNALLEACVDRKVEQKLMFQTGQISAVSPDKKVDPLGTLVDLNNYIIKTDDRRKDGGLPLKGDVNRKSSDTGSPIENFYHYIVLNANGSALTYVGSGKYADDIEAGRFHVQIGSNRGIVKTVQFAKTDMQYIREARFFRQGIDGLLQLSSVYTANVEMFGNTLFYPGMELWIDPYGMGGTHIGRPQQGGNNRSLANILGLGGYHTITGVSTTITPNSFTTKLKSHHYYSGDGETPEKSQPKIVKKKSDKDVLIEQGINEDDQTGEQKQFCTDTILESYKVNDEEAAAREPQAIEYNIENTPAEGNGNVDAAAQAGVQTTEQNPPTIQELTEKYMLHGKPTMKVWDDIAGEMRLVSGTWEPIEREGKPDALYFVPDEKRLSKVRVTE